MTPVYWRQPEATAEAFDADGFYRMGDAGRLADPDQPERGIVFGGRIAEDFKLLSGTWVQVGALRVALIAALAPLIADAVITGHDRDEVGALVFPDLAALRTLCPGLAADTAPAEVFGQPPVRRAIVAGLHRLGAAGGGSSGRIGRVLLLAEPPSIDANEITDKGYLNQRAVLNRRAVQVEGLYAGDTYMPIVTI